MNRDILSCSNVANRDIFFSSLGTALIRVMRHRIETSGWHVRAGRVKHVM